MSNIPVNLQNFTNWLKAAGAEILRPTSKWEILRFRGSEGVGIIYTNSKGKKTFNDASTSAFDAYKYNTPWTGKCAKVKRTKKDQHYDALVERDGEQCLFCGSEDNLTLEHIVPINCGGRNHLSNLALLCRECNQAVGHMSAAEKFRFGMEVRANV